MTNETTRLQARVKVLEDALRRLLVAADGESYSEYSNAIEDGAAALAASIPADPVTNAGCCQAMLAERDDLRAKLEEMEEVVSSYRTVLLEFGIDGSKGSKK